ncbi:MAG TPA: class II aldolase/adducin family protein, partial [Sphingomonadales bacterium]|nr:class II aldolase/adducin family protein [Sphingomonadales bacterium]
MTRQSQTHRSLKESVPEAEWALRCDLAACYRMVALLGWDDLIFTHFSVRLPGAKKEFLINPFGVVFEDITASKLVRIDLDGRPLHPTPYPVNPAGFVLHSSI